MTVTIINWKKYNPRTDVKHSSWFRLEQILFEDSDLYGLKLEEMGAWIYLLCQASKKNNETFAINFEHAKIVGRLSEKVLKSTISKLKAIDKIRYVDVTCASVDVTCAGPTNERTNETRRTNSDFDFEKVYEGYPRKEGKTDGMKKCHSDIKSQIEYEDLIKAVAKYAKTCREERREKKYIKQFSTFMSTWRDWIPKIEEKKELPKPDPWLEPRALDPQEIQGPPVNVGDLRSKLENWRKNADIKS